MSENVRVPDSISPLVAWRCWGVTETRDGCFLISNPDGWPTTLWPREQALEAVCRAGHEHDAPYDSCTCGIYALADEIPYYSYEDGYVVFGEVYLFGAVIRGSRGFRAQKARPKSLFLAHRHYAYAPPLRSAYGIPVRLVDPFDFQKKGPDHGYRLAT